MTNWQDVTPSGPTDWVPGPDGIPGTYTYVAAVGSTVQLDANALQGWSISTTDPVEGQYLRFVSGVIVWETLVGGGGSSDHSLLTNLSSDDHTQYLNTTRHNLSTHTSSNVDHGNTAGLGDDDHAQYLNVARHDLVVRHSAAWFDHGGLLDLTADDHTQYLNAARHNLASHTSSNVDHGSTAGLGDDDHTQYLNTARHDLTARHGIGTVVPSGTPGSSAPGDSVAAGSANSVARSDHLHGREAHGSGQHGSTIVDHGSIGGLTDDDHTAYLNNARHDIAARHPVGIFAGTQTAGFALTIVGTTPTWLAIPAQDHGTTGGLGDDDHTQYLNNARHDIAARHPVGIFAGTQTSGFVLTLSGTTPTWLAPSGGGVTYGSPASSAPGDASADGVATSVTRSDHKHARESHGSAEHGSSIVDHGTIGGLGDDDHSQYLNIARHDLAARHSAGWFDHGGLLDLTADDHTQYLNTARHAAGDHTITDTVDESIAVLSTQIGIASGTPRVVLSTGTASSNWQIDNNAGEFRWITPGNARMTLRPDPLASTRTHMEITDGWISAMGRWNDAGTTARAHIGSSTVPADKAAVGLFTGTNNQKWVMANDTGSLVYYKNGLLEATLTDTALNLASGNEYQINAVPMNKIVRTTATQTFAVVAIADMTSMVLPVLANTDYQFEAIILYQANATTTGIITAVNGPASATVFAFSEVITTVAGANERLRISALNTGVTHTATSVATATTVCQVRGIMRVAGTAGNLQIRIGSEVAIASGIVTQPGSTLILNG